MRRVHLLLATLAPALLVLLLWGCQDDGVLFASSSGDAGAPVGASCPGDAASAEGGAASPDGGARADSGAPRADSGVAPPTTGPYLCPPLGGAVDGGPFAPSNFDPTQLDASALCDVDISDVDGGCAFDTYQLTLHCAHQTFAVPATRVPQDGGLPLAVFSVGAFTIEPGVVVDVRGGYAFALLAHGAIDIGGELRSAPSSTPTGSFSNGSGSFCGHSGSDSTKYGSASASPLLRGSSDYTGAMQLTSLVGVRVQASGLIDVNGSGGGVTSGGDGFYDHGLSGGSGGTILLEAPSVAVEGQLAANGGGGGYGDSTGPELGATSLDVAQAPGAWKGGGAGSAGDDPNGQPGVQLSDPLTGGGGSGGGAGWIAIKTRQCGAAGYLTGVMSPSPKSGCANVMPLAPP